MGSPLQWGVSGGNDSTPCVVNHGARRVVCPYRPLRLNPRRCDHGRCLPRHARHDAPRETSRCASGQAQRDAARRRRRSLPTHLLVQSCVEASLYVMRSCLRRRAMDLSSRLRDRSSYRGAESQLPFRLRLLLALSPQLAAQWLPTLGCSHRSRPPIDRRYRASSQTGPSCAGASGALCHLQEYAKQNERVHPSSSFSSDHHHHHHHHQYPSLASRGLHRCHASLVSA